MKERMTGTAADVSSIHREETPAGFVGVPGNPATPRDTRLVLSERALRRRIRKSLAWGLLMSALISFGVSLFVSVTVRDRVRGPERLSDLHFPAQGELSRGAKVALNPGDINHLDDAAWRVLESQTWTRIACRNSTIQGSGPGHDVSFTVLRGPNPHALLPTTFSCRIVGSSEDYGTCDITGGLAFKEGEWVTIEVLAGLEIENSARPFCEVHRYKGDTLTTKLLRRAV